MTANLEKELKAALKKAIAAREQIGLWRDELRTAMDELEYLESDIDMSGADFDEGIRCIERAIDRISGTV